MQQTSVTHTRPNWAEISLSALRSNFLKLQTHVGDGVTLCAVVKCHAYGHGVVKCARALENHGAKWLGVTSTEEGVLLREHDVRTRVLLMTGFFPGEEEDVVRFALAPAVSTEEHLERLEKAAERLGVAAQSVPVHVKVDTGMSRLGVSIPELPKFAQRLKNSRYIKAEGVFSHLASAEVLDAEDAKVQTERFGKAVAVLAAEGVSPRYRHLANSAAVLARPEAWHNMARPGIALYGFEMPAPDGERPTLGLSPVLSWKTRVIALRNVCKGQAVGYNGAYVCKQDSRLAVLAVGYGDGLSRKLSSRGRVIVRDCYAPIVGNVSMDVTIIDVTAIPGVEIGDEVTLIGRTESREVSAMEHARISGTIVYETLCNVSARVPRLYTE